jgi:hypothetical protein
VTRKGVIRRLGRFCSYLHWDKERSTKKLVRLCSYLVMGQRKKERKKGVQRRSWFPIVGFHSYLLELVVST